MRRTVYRAEGRRLSRLFMAMLQTVTRGRSYPTQTRFGDGRRIPMRYPAAVQEALDAVTVAVQWQPGDVLLLDNYLMMHGRAPFEGNRVVGACLLNGVLGEVSAAAQPS